MKRFDYISDETVLDITNEFSDFFNMKKSEYIKTSSLYIYNKYITITGKDYSSYSLAALRTNLYDAVKKYSKHLKKDIISEDEIKTLINVYDKSKLNPINKITSLPCNFIIKDATSKKNCMLNKILEVIPSKEFTVLSA